MKRFLVGIVWFVGLYFSTLMLGGMVASAVDTASLDQQTLHQLQGDAAASYERGVQAGRDFGSRYSGVILLGALGVSLVGTTRGWLPGTRRVAAQDTRALSLPVSN
jgi:hypothetical protein